MIDKDELVGIVENAFLDELSKIAGYGSDLAHKAAKHFITTAAKDAPKAVKQFGTAAGALTGAGVGTVGGALGGAVEAQPGDRFGGAVRGAVGGGALGALGGGALGRYGAGRSLSRMSPEALKGFQGGMADLAKKHGLV